MTKSSLRRRFAAGLVGAFAAATALVATSAGTATAATTCATSVTLTSYKAANEYGWSNSLSARTTAPEPCGSPFYGDTVIEKWTGSSWAVVETGSASGAYYSAGGSNLSATYRARYTGSTGEASSYNWTPSTSAAKAVGVYRSVKASAKSVRNGVKATFKVTPASSIAGQKVVIQVKKGGGWKKYKKVKFKGNGKAKTFIGAPSRKKTRYRMIFPTNRGLVTSTYTFWTRRY